MGYLPWQRPGIDLGIKLGEMAKAQSRICRRGAGQPRPLHLGQRPPRTATTRRCASSTRPPSGSNATRKKPAFKGAKVETLCRTPSAAPWRAACCRRSAAASRSTRRKVGHFVDSPEVLEFVNSKQLEQLAPLGTSCPDHFLRTKIRPLIVPHDADGAALDALIDGYRADYAAYYERCKHAELARHARSQCGDLSRAAASACCPSPRTRRRRASPPSSMSTPST